MQDGSHPGVALDAAACAVVATADRDRSGQLGDCRLADVDLAEGRQHVADVREEGAVGPDDQDATARDPFLVGVQQVGDAVQSDRGLAGTRGALDADGLADVGADDVVLLGLDRGDDVAHRAGPGPLDLLDQQQAHAGSARRPRACGQEPLVLEGGQVPAGETEPAAQRKAHRVGPAGAVERPGHRGAPVDDHGWPPGVVYVAAADVEGLAARRPVVRAAPCCAVIGGRLPSGRPVRVVQPAEEQGRAGRSCSASARWYSAALRYSSEIGSPPSAFKDSTSSRISWRNSRD